MPTWLRQNWIWPVLLVGGYFGYRYVKGKQAATAATSGTAIPIGGSPFNFPDNSQPDAGVLLPTSSIPTTATTSTNSSTGTAATGSPSLVNGTGLPGSTGLPGPQPRVNFYSAAASPVSAMAATSGGGPGGERRAF